MTLGGECGRGGGQVTRRPVRNTWVAFPKNKQPFITEVIPNNDHSKKNIDNSQLNVMSETDTWSGRRRAAKR